MEQGAKSDNRDEGGRGTLHGGDRRHINDFRQPARNGRLTPRDVMASSVYTEALTGGAAGECAAWYETASESERAEAAALGHANQAELARQREESPPPPVRPVSASRAYDEESFEYRI